MSKIILMRGLPASGKSTKAKEILNQDPSHSMIVSRDDIRITMFGKHHGVDEDAVSEVEMASVKAGLREGKTVIIDAMHLRQSYVNRWQKLGYPIEIVECYAPLNVLLARNHVREKQVPAEFLKKNYEKFAINKMDNLHVGVLKPVQLKPDEFMSSGFEPYVRKFPGLPCWIFDIDGTLAHNDGHRSFYDYTQVGGDKVHEHVKRVAQALSHDDDIVIVSGRKDESWDDTYRWLYENQIPFDKLFMRDSGDNRSDAIVKYEILKKKIKPHYDVQGVFDDRPSVIRMWENVGLPVFKLGNQEKEF